MKQAAFRKNWKKFLALLVFLLQVLLIGGFFWWIAKNTVLKPYTDLIQQSWHVNIVGENTCIYSKDEGTPEGIRYHAFAYEDRMDFQGLNLSEGRKGVSVVNIQDLLAELEVPQKEQPDFDAVTKSAAIYSRTQDNRDRFYLLVDENSKTFYVMELFM